ncbi:MAG: HNH endonuclease [Nocardioidaceae bacterium]
MVEVRDEICRTPWCGAPIRHADHVVAVEAGGETSEPNGQGLCEACNHAKQAHRWRSRPGPGGAGESVQITTPTGHAYISRPPPLPGALPTLPRDTWTCRRRAVARLWPSGREGGAVRTGEP